MKQPTDPNLLTIHPNFLGDPSGVFDQTSGAAGVLLASLNATIFFEGIKQCKSWYPAEN